LQSVILSVISKLNFAFPRVTGKGVARASEAG